MTEICIVIGIFIIIIGIIIVKLINNMCRHEWEIIENVCVDTGGMCDYDRLYLRCKNVVLASARK